MNKAILIAAALALAPLPALSQGTPPSGQGSPQQRQGQPATGQAQPPSEQEPNATPQPKGGGSSAFLGQGAAEETHPILERLLRSQFGERLSEAISRVRQACGPDIEELCGSVSPGQGRLAMCMRDNADMLSRRCEFTLWRVARGLRNAVEQAADTCLSEIQAQCGTAERVGQCVSQKKDQLSPGCQTVVAALEARGQAQTEAGMRGQLQAMRGMPVFSSDDMNVGEVAEVVRGPDGKIQSIRIDVGRMLGIGSKIVTVSPDRIQQLSDRIKLRLSEDQLRSMPETRSP